MRAHGRGGDAGIVDENVGAAEFLFDKIPHGARQMLRRLTSTSTASALPLRLLYERCGFVGARHVAVCADDGCAECGKPQSEGSANAKTCAGYDGDLAVHAKHVCEH